MIVGYNGQFKRTFGIYYFAHMPPTISHLLPRLVSSVCSSSPINTSILAIPYVQDTNALAFFRPFFRPFGFLDLKIPQL